MNDFALSAISKGIDASCPDWKLSLLMHALGNHTDGGRRASMLKMDVVVVQVVS